MNTFLLMTLLALTAPVQSKSEKVKLEYDRNKKYDRSKKYDRNKLENTFDWSWLGLLGLLGLAGLLGATDRGHKTAYRDPYLTEPIAKTMSHSVDEPSRSRRN